MRKVYASYAQTQVKIATPVPVKSYLSCFKWPKHGHQSIVAIKQTHSHTVKVDGSCIDVQGFQRDRFVTPLKVNIFFVICHSTLCKIVKNFVDDITIEVSYLKKCFSTFSASSPGSRQNFELLSRSNFFAMIMSQYFILFYIVSSKRVRVIQVFLRLFSNLFLFLTKFKNSFLVHFMFQKYFKSRKEGLQFPIPGRVPAVEKHSRVSICIY